MAWVLLTGLVAGCSIWATHFIAMLAYTTGLRVGFLPSGSLASLLIAAVFMAGAFGAAASVGSVLHSGSTGGSSATGASRAMLHSKLLVIDNQLTVIGSMNLDMRSQYQNTEIAVLIGSHTLSAKATEVIEAGLRDGAWRVQLTDDKRLIWVAPPDGDRQNQTTEPDASLGLRLMLQLLGPLAPDSLL